MISDYGELLMVVGPIVGGVVILGYQMLAEAGARRQFREQATAPQLLEFDALREASLAEVARRESREQTLEEAKRCVRSEESRQGLRLTAAARSEAEARWRELSK